MRKSGQNTGQNKVSNAWAHADLGLRMGLAIILPGWLGYWCDSKLDTSPVMLLLGCMLGLAAGMYDVIRSVEGMQTKGDSPPADPSDPATSDSKSKEPPDDQT